ncbi:MAG: FG-GAP-like repeat-containing protein, partial [Candidatus Acidiferrales bacterium]
MSRIARSALFAGIFACALNGASRPPQQDQQNQQAQPSEPRGQQRTHSHASAAKKAEAASDEEKGNPRAEIIRENNFGVALMNRQQFEQALGKFQRACILDPQSDVGCLNTGIALLNMQRFDEARQILEKAAQRNARDPRAWFNLGLLEKATGNADAAIADFVKVATLDSYDADTQYFIGLVYSQQQQYDKAIPAFQRALELNPFQVSAEFGLAQALQRTSKTAQAKEHFDRFQHMTSLKLGKPVSFIYGEQGKYSLAEIMQPAPEPVPPLVPVHFVNVTAAANLPAFAPRITVPPLAPKLDAAPARTRRSTKTISATKFTEDNPANALERFLGSGACIIDYNGDGKPDIFLVDADGRGTAGLYKNLGYGKFVNVTHESKLEIRGPAMGCAVGDYDNDGKPDLAVTINGGVLLFHNEGNETFKDVTEAAGLKTDPQSDVLALGVTFIDYDHDGDLDLYVTRFNAFPLENPAQAFAFPNDATPPGNIFWRNNGNGTFTEWTSQTALAGAGPSVGAIGSDINND